MNNKQYGEYGGQYVAESLMNTLKELETAYREAIKDPEFIREYEYYLKDYVGRETPLYLAEKLSEKYGTKIYLKREDLNHTAPTRSTMSSDRSFWQNVWERKKSLPRPEPVSTAWPPPPERPSSVWNVPCIWVRRIWQDSPQCFPDGNARRPGGMREDGKPYIEGCHQRSDPYLGKKCGGYLYIIGSAVGPHTRSRV